MLFCLVLGGMLEAQPAEGRSAWRISSVEGSLTLNRESGRSVYKNSREAAGVFLGPRDTVQIGLGKAELTLDAVSGSPVVLSLGDNTSLQILSENSLLLELFYGRIRIRAERPVQFRYGGALLALEGDVACDYTARPGGTAQPVLAVHCFSGRGDLIPRSGEDSPKIPVRADESLSLEYRVPFMYVERKNIDPQVVAYWNPGSVKEKRAEIPAAAVPAQETARGKTGNIKNGNIITGLLLMGAGAAMQGYSYFGSPGQDAEKGLLYGGYGALGLGTVFLLGGALYNR